MIKEKSCYFDGVNGNVANLFFTTIPLVLIILMNSSLYILTWYRIRREEPQFKSLAGRDAKVIRKSHRAAKTMSLFVTAFFIQWLPMAMYGLWQYSTPQVPILLFQCVTTFSNVGGVLNGIVYYIIRRRKTSNRLQMSVDERSFSTPGTPGMPRRPNTPGSTRKSITPSSKRKSSSSSRKSEKNSFRDKTTKYSFRNNNTMSPKLTRLSKVSEEGLTTEVIQAPIESEKCDDVIANNNVCISMSDLTIEDKF